MISVLLKASSVHTLSVQWIICIHKFQCCISFAIWPLIWIAVSRATLRLVVFDTRAASVCRKATGLEFEMIEDCAKGIGTEFCFVESHLGRQQRT
jgi:hypothetical protein